MNADEQTKMMEFEAIWSAYERDQRRTTADFDRLLNSLSNLDALELINEFQKRSTRLALELSTQEEQR